MLHFTALYFNPYLVTWYTINYEIWNQNISWINNKIYKCYVAVIHSRHSAFARTITCFYREYLIHLWLSIYVPLVSISLHTTYLSGMFMVLFFDMCHIFLLTILILFLCLPVKEMMILTSITSVLPPSLLGISPQAFPFYSSI